MIDTAEQIPAILKCLPTQVIFGSGRLRELGELVRSAGASRVLLVTDPGIVAAGHAERATFALRSAGLQATVLDDVSENPTTLQVDAGAARARAERVDFLVGLGGGSAMDCTKGINLLLACGGKLSDYRGDPSLETLAARPPLYPMILVPTTAGTGSEAQSFALVSDAETHQKMACGDRRLPTNGGLRPRVAILDPELTRTAPTSVAAASGIDAIAHAVETSGCRIRSEVSRELSREAWSRLASAFEHALQDSTNDHARAAMLLGAHLAGAAIENAMLGAAHACANPLTARFGITHGIAVGLMLPHVIRFNAAGGINFYSDLADDPDQLAARVEKWLELSIVPQRLSQLGIPRDALTTLAADAASQWTAGFNPLMVGAAELRQMYDAAF